MKMELDVELRDVPGQLSFVLDRISEHGGNIESVIHRRADARDEWVPVRIIIDIAPRFADALLEQLQTKVRVLTAGGEARGVPMPLMLVGHVFDNRIDAFLETLQAHECRIHRMQAEMTNKDQPSAVFIDLTATSQEALTNALAALSALAERSGVTILRGMPEVSA